ncbi:uncharacterized protein LOC143085629 isoform X1 [Mytilus galloprovincialis]|uniref:uncharacterized protein LOC143085629 isoform X1 n=1 Tax=Mytilus galloprovincialis TaxID=29158 RepID=UPI003F7C36F2
MDAMHLLVLSMLILIGIVILGVVCVRCWKICRSCYYNSLNGAYRNTEDREPIPQPVINRRRLRHYTTETQTAVPLLCVQCIPITIKLTRTDSKCVICLDPKEEEADIVALRCAHTFHRSCINKSLDNKQECPLCRTQLYSSCMEYSV